MPARRGVKRQAAAVNGAENGGVPATNSRKGQNSKRNEVVDEEANNTELPAKRKRSARVVKDEEEYSKSETDKEETPKKGRRGKKPKAPIVYDIPPIRKTRDFRLEGPEERRAERAHGFQGRLGYACLNTVLRNQDPPVFCSRNVRIKTIEEKGIESVKEMALQNVRDIIPLLEFNAANNIFMMRLSSEIFPFASHEQYGYDISYAAKELAEAGEVAKRLRQRLTMHPGQFCQLGTPKESVLQASIRELEVHAKVLDLMGVDSSGVMILHGGGTFGDRQATLERIRATINTKLPDFVRRRLVLENDEMGYSAEELLPLCESLDPPVPLVFDFHHDLLRPSSLSPAEIVQRAQAIFARRGIRPKYHLSEPRPGAVTIRDRRAHSDRCGALPGDLPSDADLMLECKDKEQGVLEMYRIYRLYDVNHDVLRPPANDNTMATSGRRVKLNGSGGSRMESPPSDTDGSVEEKNVKPVTARVTDRSLIEKAIAKAKAVAAKRGKKYVGPRSQEDIHEAQLLFKTTEQVRQEMEKEAEWVRNELRAGRERRPFPGTELDQLGATGEAPPPEPEAY